MCLDNHDATAETACAGQGASAAAGLDDLVLVDFGMLARQALITNHAQASLRERLGPPWAMMAALVGGAVLTTGRSPCCWLLVTDR